MSTIPHPSIINRLVEDLTELSGLDNIKYDQMVQLFKNEKVNPFMMRTSDGLWHIVRKHESWIRAGSYDIITFLYAIPVEGFQSGKVKYIEIVRYDYDNLTKEMTSRVHQDHYKEMKKYQDIRNRMGGLEGLMDL